MSLLSVAKTRTDKDSLKNELEEYNAYEQEVHIIKTIHGYLMSDSHEKKAQLAKILRSYGKDALEHMRKYSGLEEELFEWDDAKKLTKEYSKKVQETLPHFDKIEDTYTLLEGYDSLTECIHAVLSQHASEYLFDIEEEEVTSREGAHFFLHKDALYEIRQIDISLSDDEIKSILVAVPMRTSSNRLKCYRIEKKL